jgi:hypothetical protein
MNKPIKDRILQIYGHDPATLDELAQCVLAVIQHQTDNNVVGFAWNICHQARIGCTHGGPEGHIRNWRGSTRGVPQWYPGWSGRVWIRYGQEPTHFGHDPFAKTLTHTGTGGRGTYDGPWDAISTLRYLRYGHTSPAGMCPTVFCYSWDYRLYEADWPVLAHWVDQQNVATALSQKPWHKQHTFEWTDPTIAAADANFIAECSTI